MYYQWELELLNLNTIVVNDILDNIKYSFKIYMLQFLRCLGSTGRVIANEESPLKFDINSQGPIMQFESNGERLCEYHRKIWHKKYYFKTCHTFGVGQSIKNDKRVILELIKKALFIKDRFDR